MRRRCRVSVECSLSFLTENKYFPTKLVVVNFMMNNCSSEISSISALYLFYCIAPRVMGEM